MKNGLRLTLMITRALFLVLGLLLTACVPQKPYYEFGVCLKDADDLAVLKTVVTRVAAQYGAAVDDYSMSADNDLKALDSPIAHEQLLALLVEDKRWLSKSGVIMINNIGASSPTSVGISMFRNNDLLGSNRNTRYLRRDLITASSSQWKIIDAPSSDGTYLECDE